MEEGSVVANLAADLGLDIESLPKREIRLDIIDSRKYLEINKDTELEITDINDNAPHFRRDRIQLDISESAAPGERFSITNAVDPDVGSNSVKTYTLSESEHFKIEIQTGRDGSKFADLILKKHLDREEQAVHNLILTAIDGGVPSRSGTASIIVHVLDTNDNAPQFDQDIYTVNITENSPIGSLVIKLNATDIDEGPNAEILYTFTIYTSERTQQAFDLNPDNGEIKVKGEIDYEETKVFEIHVEAKDKGQIQLSAQSKLIIFVTDMNDNYPVMSIKSFKSHIEENVDLGTVIALISVSDRDSGENGRIELKIDEQLPFSLQKSSGSHYDLVVTKPLDREKVPEYEITLTVKDMGSPVLSDNETISLELLDVNDNAPQFPKSFYTIPVMENNAPGSLLIEEVIPRSTDKGYLITKVIAIDTDSVQNSRVTYLFLQIPDATLFSLDQYNGEIRTMRMFSYRDPRHQRLVVVAKDNGNPSLSATVTIKLSTVEHVVKAFAETSEVPLEYDIFSDLNLYLVIGLGLVSFLLLMTILVTIVLKCQKPKPTKPTPPCRNSVVSQRSSTVADSTLVSNDAYWYSLFLAETRKGKVVEYGSDRDKRLSSVYAAGNHHQQQFFVSPLTALLTPPPPREASGGLHWLRPTQRPLRQPFTDSFLKGAPQTPTLMLHLSIWHNSESF
ncbi:hypothetical protein JZ751_006874 [Albula glossodonta]|uniref:Cadherin domain-containing protein n=1 Tax=Albula glossodonta TaxID=121402 RepID=A0A8T2NZL8_9TELE|nr:hypothetical protein JZ751_006874 [Albula glossodonta]